MKLTFVIFSLLVGSATSAETNPIAKVIEMVSDLEAKVIKEGHEAQKVYTEFAEMCEDRSRELHYEIKTGKANVEELTATIEKAGADIEVLNEKIENFAAEVAEDENDLKKATEVRKKENLDFKAEEAELLKTINTIERAAGIIEREMNGGASFAQVSNAKNVVEALSAMVNAQIVSTQDGATLTALLQSQSNSEEDEDEPGAPAATVYENQSGGIVETLNGLLEKAEAQLDEVRKEETKSKNAYEMQRQSLEDKINFADKELAETKKGLAATEEKKATAEGDLEGTKKDLAEDKKDLSALHHECMTEATNFEESTKSRGEELKALATAKKIITETTGGATEQTYDLAQTSFLQVKASTKSSEAAHAVSMVRKLAYNLHSQVLAQLAQRMQNKLRHGNAADVFGKVKTMIREMIDKLQTEQEEAATKKAYCDKEMSETQKKQDDKEATIESMTTKIDVMTAESKKLKAEVATLQKELANLSRTQAEMDKLRAEEKEQYEKNKPEMEMGLAGVKQALKVLREYYAKGDKSHDDNEGAGTGIIGMLEVCESDFSKGLAEMVAAEEAAEKKYEETTDENNVVKATKEQDVKYKKQEYVALDKGVAELKADRSGEEDELAAVNEYFAGIKKECIAKPESYEERVKRRNAEIDGLKEALNVLNGEAVLLQRTSVHRTLRGAAQ